MRKTGNKSWGQEEVTTYNCSDMKMLVHKNWQNNGDNYTFPADKDE
jgi:hypothetical protein